VGNQLQPINGQTDESAQRVAAQLENMKLKMEMLESKCAKKDLEIQNLKQEIDEKKDMEGQFKTWKKNLL
jgi:hypothetical protein